MAKLNEEQNKYIYQQIVKDKHWSSSNLVDEAKDPKSVLHNLFNWDDEEEARKNRLREAGRIIRTVRIHWEHKVTAFSPVRVSYEEGDRVEFREKTEIAKDRLLKKDVLKVMISLIHKIAVQYDFLAEFSEIVDMDKLQELEDSLEDFNEETIEDYPQATL